MQEIWTNKKQINKGVDFHDLGSVQKIRTRSQVRLDDDLGSPTAALADALKGTEQKRGLVQSSAASDVSCASARVPELEAFGSYCPLTGASCTMCELRMLEIVLCGDEENGAKCLEPFLDVFARSTSGMLVDIFSEDEELARTELSSFDGSLVAGDAGCLVS